MQPKSTKKENQDMPTFKFMNYKTGKMVQRKVKSKETSGIFGEKQYTLYSEDHNMEFVTKEEYDQMDVPETENERAEYFARLDNLRKSGKCELPPNWKAMTTEEQCEYLTQLLKEILEIDCDYSLRVTLQYDDGYASAFVQFSDEDCLCGYEYHFVRCHLVRRESQPSDLPKQYQEWAKDMYGDEWEEEEAEELVAGGKNFAEAMENLFYIKILLLFHGYECLYHDGDYADYCSEHENEDEDNFDMNFDEEDNDWNDEEDEAEDDKEKF